MVQAHHILFVHHLCYWVAQPQEQEQLEQTDRSTIVLKLTYLQISITQ